MTDEQGATRGDWHPWDRSDDPSAGDPSAQTQPVEASHLGGLLPVIHAVISEDPLLLWTVSVVTNITSAAIPPRGFTSLSMHSALGSFTKLRLLSLRLMTASEVLSSSFSKCPGLVVFQSSCALIKSEVTTATGNWTKGIVMKIAEFHLFRRSVNDTLPFHSMRPLMSDSQQVQ